MPRGGRGGFIRSYTRKVGGGSSDPFLGNYLKIRGPKVLGGSYNHKCSEHLQVFNTCKCLTLVNLSHLKPVSGVEPV